MNSQILAQAFSYGTKPVRTTLIDGEPWFILSDVCEILEVKQPQNFLKSKRCDPEGVRKTYTLTEGGEQEVTIINEGNLYAVVMRSNKDEAITFQRWVTHDVIPEIRKTGRYAGAPLGISDDPILATLGAIAEMRTRQLQIDQRVENIDTRLADLEFARERTQEAIAALPAPAVPVKQATAREAIQEAIRALAVATGNQDFHGLWSRVYARFESRFHVSLSKRQANGGFKCKLDVVESLGRMDDLHAIVGDMVANARLVA